MNVPMPCLVREPAPTLEITPAKVTEGVAVPNVRLFAPSVTELVVLALIKSPIVVDAVVRPLMSKIPDPLTVTAPVDAKEPVPERLNSPELIVVPPVYVEEPVKTSWPAPPIVSEFAPPPIPVDNVSIVLAAGLMMPAPVRVMVRAEVNVIVVAKVAVPKLTPAAMAPREAS
jgi:hypothetical protein